MRRLRPRRTGAPGQPGSDAPAGPPAARRHARGPGRPARRVDRPWPRPFRSGRRCSRPSRSVARNGALDMTAGYALTRIQFCRAIGSFQAVKQGLAEILIQVESARPAVSAAAERVRPTMASSGHLLDSRADDHGGLRLGERADHPTARGSAAHGTTMRTSISSARSGQYPPDTAGAHGAAIAAAHLERTVSSRHQSCLSYHPAIAAIGPAEEKRCPISSSTSAAR
jgi:Acyl-CoA dehydrogenase, C-terminal domain